MVHVESTSSAGYFNASGNPVTAKEVSRAYSDGIVGFNNESVYSSFDIVKFEYWLNNTKYSGVATNMQNAQFAWMLNTSNGTEENSGVWTRGTEGYPTFANADSLPIYRVVFNDEGITSNRYTNYQGFVVFPEDPEPAEGSIFSGWFNSEDVKVKPSMVFVMDQTINAVYTDASDVFWNINFYNADSTLLSSQTLQHGSIVDYHGETPSIPATAKYTYIFAGWNVEPTNATENFDYYAVYDSVMNSYKVVFQDYDKKELKSLTYEYGATPRFSEKLTRASSVEWNYSHVGWDPAITAVTEEAVYTAVYDSSKVEYTVTFMNGTEVLETLKVPYGSAATPSVTPTRVGYKFIGWSPKFGNITADLTVKAMFEELVYRTVSIKEENGEIIDNVDVEENGKFTLPSAAEKTGYKFDGWYDSKGNCLGQPGDVITISADISIEARYSILSYTITFVDEDGSVIESGSVEFGSMPTASKEPTKASTAQYTYEFAGWTPEFVAVSGNAIYTATYNAVVRNYTVTFADENGKALSSSSVAYGKIPTAPATEPTKAATVQYNYTFAGWTPELVKVTGDATYKATFTSALRNYTITFVDEDGSEISKSAVAYGESPVAPAEPTRTSTAQYSYEFAGWSPAVTAVSGNATYTATYTSKVRTYEITFVDEDGSEISKSAVAYGESPVAPAEPTKASTAQYSYEFAGWTPGIVKVTGDATYKASYNSVLNAYKVTFLDYDGSTLKSQNVKYGAAATAPADPERDGYKFTGWDKSFDEIVKNTDVTAQYEKLSSSSIPASSSSQPTSSSSAIPASSSSAKNESSSSEKGEAVIEMAAAPHFSVEIVGRNIQISAARIGSAYMILDVQGRVLKQGRVNVDNFNIAVPRAGNYLIRIGNQTRSVIVR
ncbi:InlB B-repeat-containing protein [Fibrobacter sp. UWH9]|uniref:InlB B-repeat-containing protein n=1 Tax=Fibrobacter sp. UWH9 TaxID=1896213 RepID=UPI000932F5CA|nr:InlB B-repeat-containing protein [Fibrobacter sp. UWH9]